MINLRSGNFIFKEIELIIFDKDGTISDSHSFWLEIIKRRSQIICSKYKLDTSMFNLLQIAMGADLVQNKLSPKGPVAIEGRTKVIEEVIKTLYKNNITVKEKDIIDLMKIVHESFAKDAHQFVKPIKSACNFIDTLPIDKVKIALVTSDSSRNAKIMLNKINLRNKFDLILGGDANLGTKKSGGPAKYVCKKLGIPAKKTLAIGDAEMDFLMSRNADLAACILVATGQIPIQVLKKVSPYTIPNLDYLNLVT